MKTRSRAAAGLQSAEIPLVHTREVFNFTAYAPIDTVFPLFGADRERLWAPNWNPLFVWPLRAGDQEGMVFTVKQGDKTAVWVNTALDQIANRVEYVYVIPDVVATVITLCLTAGRASTDVRVTYVRTALTVAANEIVISMAARDRVAGREWGEQINTYLQAGP